MLPKDNIKYTAISNSTYPNYRGRPVSSVPVSGKFIDNRGIVPYNKLFLQKYNCCINIEICFPVKSIKYIIKYFHK